VDKHQQGAGKRHREAEPVQTREAKGPVRVADPLHIFAGVVDQAPAFGQIAGIPEGNVAVLAADAKKGQKLGNEDQKEDCMKKRNPARPH